MSPVAFKARLAVNPGEVGGGPDGTQNYVEVTIDSTQVATTLTDFPVYVDLSDLPAAFFTGVQADGGDIRVTENDGTTRCPVDLVAIDTGASTGELHYLAASLSSSSDTVFRIYYNASTTQSQPGVATTYGRNAVWADYAAVYHGDDTTDSTGNGNTLTAAGDAATGYTTNSKIGDALNLDGVGDYLTAADSASLDITGDVTLSAWGRATQWDNTAGFSAMVGKWDTGANERAYGVWFTTSSTSLAQMTAAFSDDGTTGAGSYAPRSTSGNQTAASAWHHYASTIDVSGGGNGIQAYVDGSAETMDASSAAPPSSIDSNTAPLIIGDHYSSGSPLGRNWYGQVDEVRVRSSLASADWVASEHTNQNTPTTFYTVGTEQTA